MVITDFEMAQATIQIFGGCICLMILTIILMNRQENYSMKVFRWLFLDTAFIFFFEGAAYIFRGNTNTISRIMSQVLNCGVFLFNIILANLFVRYLYGILEENGIEPSNFMKKWANGSVIAVVLILLTNFFTGWMYYFDAENYYHRNYLWYVYTAINLVCILLGCNMAFKYRKRLHFVTLASSVLFAFMPIIAIVVQTFIYGFSITNIGLGIAVILMLISYLVKWSRSDYVDKDEDEKRRKLLQLLALFLIMVISMSASIVSCLISIERISVQKAEDDNRVVAHMINNGIENEFLRPITVSTTMAKDNVLKQYIVKSGEESPEAAEQEMAEYLTAIRDGFDYQMVFVGCEESRAYYSYEGISKILDIENDPHDVWYRDFRLTDKAYSLNVDTDEVNNWALSVFVNTRVMDEEGNMLGACGVAVDMEHLKELLVNYENTYGVKVALVNKDGLIQVCTDGEKIEKDTIEITDMNQVTADEFRYEKLESSIRMIKYVEDLDWYLIVEDIQPNKINLRAVTLPSVFIFVAGLFMMALAFGVISIREQKAEKQLHENRLASITDELTGLLNRHAYEEEVAMIEGVKKTADIAYAMLDLNGLKAVNDNLGHAAGDELIQGAASCMIATLVRVGRVYRIGGDEFAVIFDSARELVEEAFAKFDEATASWQGELVKELTISKGIVFGSDHPEKTMKELIELADQLMYEDKDRYYEKTGKKRRK